LLLSFLLTFALAEQDEIRKNNAAARAAYEGLIKSHGSEIDKLKTSISEEVDQAKGPEIEDEEVELIKRDDEDMDGAELSETQKRRAEREARGQAVVDRRQRELEDLVTAAGVIWIMFMRFARRAEVRSCYRSSSLTDTIS
jgi:cleavage stimulation factor subunit 3